MKKRILAIVLVLSMLLSVMPISVFADDVETEEPSAQAEAAGQTDPDASVTDETDDPKSSEEPDEEPEDEPEPIEGSVWFDWPEYSTLYTDGTVECSVEYDGPDGAVLQFTAGEYDGGEWIYTFTEGSEYTVEGNTITLNGSAIAATSVSPFRIRVDLLYDDELLDYDWVDGEVCEPRLQYYGRLSDQDLLPGWGKSIYQLGDLYVENGAHPDGYDTEYRVTNVEVIENTPDVEGNNVLNLMWLDEEACWHFDAVSPGTAVLEITYADEFHDEPQSYTVRINVLSDMYGVSIYSGGGIDFALPGGTIDLYAEASHQSSEPTDEDHFEFEWILPEEYTDIATLTPDETDSSHAHAWLTFNDDLDSEYIVSVEVVAYQIDNETGDRIERARCSTDKRVILSYTELCPVSIPSDLAVGGEVPVTAEVRRYPGTDGEEYDLIENVHFRWDYDGALQITDADGVTVGYDDDCCGTQCQFTIKRIENWDTQYWLYAEWEEDGEMRYADRSYGLSELNYNVWFDSMADTVFTDGTLTLEASFEGPEGSELHYSVGYHDRENDQWVPYAEGTEYTVDGNTVTLIGSALAAAGAGYCEVRAELVKDGVSLAGDSYGCSVREPKMEYSNRLTDQEMMPEWGNNIYSCNSLYVENGTYPDGYDTEYRVTNVEVIENTPDVEGRNVLSLERFEEEDCWYYRAQSCGTAVLEITYEDEFHDGTQSYTVRFNVVSDKYDVNIWPVSGSCIALPGGTIDLHAETHHQSIYPHGRDQFEYEWVIPEEYASFAAVTPDESDSSYAQVTFSNDIDWAEVIVEVIAYEGADAETGERIERARNTIRLNVSREFTDLYPATIDSALDLGASETVDVELRHYSTVIEGGFEALDNVDFRWEFDPECIRITDANGDIVESGTTFTGDSFTFTITRLQSWETGLTLTAKRWDDEDGGHIWIERNYHLQWKNYDVWFDREPVRVYDDYPGTATLDTAQLGQLDYDLEWKVGVRQWDEETQTDVWSVLLEEGTDYTIDGNTITISSDALPNRNLNEAWIYVTVLYNGNELSSRDCRVEYRNSCSNHFWLTGYTIAPECEKPGEKLMYCWNCGEFRYEEVPATGHKLHSVAAKAATLDEAGNIAYYVCDDCGKLFSDEQGTDAILQRDTVIPKLIDIADAVITGIVDKTYTGNAITQTLAVELAGQTLTPGTDYNVTYTNNVNAGEATAVISGIGIYGGTAITKFQINAAPISDAAVTLGTTSYTYSGAAKKPAVTVKLGTKALTSGTDYTVSYKNNTNAGTATATVTGKGNYTGTASATFTIKAKKVTPTVTLSSTSYVYNGKVKTPTVTVKAGSTTLTKDTDYTVSYATGRKVVGKYAVKVTLKGNYTGDPKTVYFTIKPKGTAISTLTAASKAFTAKWTKQATQTTGYQIQYSTSKTFASGNTTVTVAKNSTVSKKITGLLASKTYYVRIRTYKTVGSTKYYSAWSAAKSVKTK